MTDEKKRKAAAERKRRSRNKIETKRLEIELSSKELEMLDWICNFRGAEVDPYDRKEAIATLIREDYKRAKKQADTLGVCTHCNNPLPKGCEKKWKGSSECYHTHKARELLIHNQPVQERGMV